MPDGRLCRAGPQRDRPYCFVHDPERAEDAKEARRLGGLRRKREVTVAIAYDLPGLETVEGIRRVLDVVVTDALGNDAPVPRLRVLPGDRGGGTRRGTDAHDRDRQGLALRHVRPRAASAAADACSCSHHCAHQGTIVDDADPEAVREALLTEATANTIGNAQAAQAARRDGSQDMPLGRPAGRCTERLGCGIA
jgi:hypothetical protein